MTLKTLKKLSDGEAEQWTSNPNDVVSNPNLNHGTFLVVHCGCCVGCYGMRTGRGGRGGGTPSL